MTRSQPIAPPISESERKARLQRWEAEIENQYQALVRKLRRIRDQLETIGETDMGVLSRRLAGRYHTITAKMRALVHELQQDALWPHEPDDLD